MKALLQPVNVRVDDHDALVDLALGCLRDCRTTAHDGTVLLCPDGSGHYDACWTRDFCYMVEGAGQLMDPGEMLGAIDYILGGQREDGTIPDRRQADGLSVYCAGPVDRPLGENPPTDNAAFMVKLVAAYAHHTGDIASFLARRDALYRAMESVPLSKDHLVFIDRNRPHAPYGFTDCIAKTGEVFFSSMLHWEACQVLGKLCAKAEQHDEAHEWYEQAEKAGRRIGDFWDEETGMFWAAGEDCRQSDLWGSAYACVIRVASKTQARRIAERFLAQWDDCVLRGHLRHLWAGEYWHRLLVEVDRGRYQNGGFWTVPSGWLAQTVALVDGEAARRLVADIVAEFTAHGVHEWISKDERALPGYVASVANVLGATQPSKGLG